MHLLLAILGLAAAAGLAAAPHGEDEPPHLFDLAHAHHHVDGSDPSAQHWLAAHGGDTASHDTGAADRSVLGRVTEASETAIDALLAAVGARPTHGGSVERAAAAYAKSLHEFKVAVGAESPYVAERLQAAAAGVHDALAPLVAAPAAWLREHAAGPHPGFSFGAAAPHGGTSAALIRDALARGLAATLTAREAALGAYDAALKRTGLRPEQRSALTRARDHLEAATGRLWAALGYGDPEPPASSWGRVEAAVQPALTHAYDAVGGAYDAGLKRAGLRPHDMLDYLTSLPLARSAFNDALHRAHARLGGGGGGGHHAPSTLHHVQAVLADAAERVAHTTAELHASLARLPAAVGERVMGGSGGGGSNSGGFAQAHVAELVRVVGRAQGDARVLWRRL